MAELVSELEKAHHERETNQVSADLAILKKIPLVEAFGPTIQGEGSIIGQQSYFLRFGLCDYRCTMCDSLHAVLPQLVKAYARRMTQQEILLDFIGNVYLPNSTKWVTFSGGNPLIHDLEELVIALKAQGFRINVETQGTLYKDWLQLVDSVTISPKGPGMGEFTDFAVLDKFMDDLMSNWGVHPKLGGPPGPDVTMKIVVFDQRDLDFAQEVFTKYGEDLSDVYPYDKCYLSLGNPNPPKPNVNVNAGDDDGVVFDPTEQLKQYRVLFEDIQTLPVLSQVKFLPQWHAFVWGNGQGH